VGVYFVEKRPTLVPYDPSPKMKNAVRPLKSVLPLLMWTLLGSAPAWAIEGRGLGVLLSSAAENSAVFGVFECDAPNHCVQNPSMNLTLLVDRRDVAPGSVLRAAVRFEVEDKWHAYHGPNTGSIGLPTEVTWKLPAGYTHTEPIWPAPVRYNEPNGDISYVHDGEFFLDVEIQIPADAKVGALLPLGAEVDYQVCNDKCVRGSADLKLELPVVAKASPALSLWSRPFERARAMRPLSTFEGNPATVELSNRPLNPGTQSVLVIAIEGNEELKAPQGERPVIVFEKRAGVEVETLETRPFHERGLRVIARVSVDQDAEASDSPLNGILQFDRQQGTGWEPFALAVQLPLLIADAESVATVNSELFDGVDIVSIVEVSEPTQKELKRPLNATIPIWQALFYALLGGLILNIMPCVLPVLSLKALALVEEANESPRTIRAFVGMYVLGVVASFWVLAGVVIILKLSGEYVGWGFQFQEPGYVLAMTGVIFAFSLSLFGVFEIPGLTVRGGSKGGLRGSFIHGVLTTALSTPCSAPLLGSALAFALLQPPLIILATFTLVGIGLALPIAVLTLAPHARRFIPRPGAWMDTFKHIIAFLLVGTAIWLLSVLNAQLTVKAMTTVFILLGLIAVASWILGHWLTPLASRPKKILAMLAAALVVGGGISRLSLATVDDNPGEDISSELIDWQHFEGQKTLELADEGYTVFIDFTADWCSTCMTNETVAIETEAVAALIKTNRVIAVKADLTRKDSETSKWVEYFGRQAIPLYVILPANRPNEPLLLPELITSGDLLEALHEAGPSKANPG